MTKHTSSDSIAEALKLLEDAAEQKSDELRTAMSDKYSNLKTLILETESGLLQSLTSAKDHAVHAATQAKDAGVEKAREVTRDVDKCVHQNPWAYIAGSAVAGLLLGALLGRNPK